MKYLGPVLEGKDIANKEYVDDAVAQKVSKSGDTMTGNINMGNFAITNLADATANQSPATFKQLNDAISGLGTVFDLKGSVATIGDLPSTGNKIGDVWYVESESVGYIWLQDTTGTLRWEKFGEEIDLSGYLTKAGLLTTVGSATDNTMTQAAITAALGTKANTANLADVAMSGLYSDLTGTPTSLPASDVYSWAKQPNKPSYTASEVGLGNVPNVNTNNQTPTWTIASALANLVSGETLSTAFGKIAKAIQSLISHISNVSNPHSVTKVQVGLGSVDNTADVNKPISTATQNALNLKVDTADLSDVAFSGLYSDLTGKPIIPANSDFDLSGLGDTAITTPANSQILQYNGTKWINANPQSFGQQQANWNETSTSSVQYIQNKPNLDLKANVNSPNLTGIPTAPTATSGTNTTQLATTAFVVSSLPTSLPANGGNADTVGGFSVGAATNNSVNSIVRTDNSGYLNCSWLKSTSGVLTGKPHGVWVENGNWLYYQTTDDFINNCGIATKEYTDTKAPLASPTLTGTPRAPTATSGTSTTQIATTAFVANAVSQVGGTTIIVSATQPASPKDGDLWYQII